ncbi:hypothetical protein BX600DRAFT_197710 [Xylariales sp. PMI_506]|nr:hypothetical protein BX600DRAFT_197710 [Xylariales sp. PMI_506]
MELGEPSIDSGMVQPHPSVMSISETLNASSHVSLPPSLPALPASTLPFSRNSRNLVIDSALARPPPNQPIRRKPLSSSASPIATRYSSGEYLAIAKALPRPEHRFSRSFSVDSPTLYEFTTIETVAGLESTAKVAPTTETVAALRDTANSSNVNEPPPSMTPNPVVKAGVLDHHHHPTSSLGLADHPQTSDYPASPQTEATAGLSQPIRQALHQKLPSEADADADNLSVLDGYNTDSSRAYSFTNSGHDDIIPPPTTRKQAPPRLSLAHEEPNNRATVASINSFEVKTPNTDKPLPRSPASSKLSSFFGWGSASPTSPESSEKAFSPIPSSPFGFSRSNTLADAASLSPRPDSYLSAPKAAYGPGNSREYCESYLATPPALSVEATAQIEEMEDELKAISAELASSIRREMDLEDLVDRLQLERDSSTTTANKRSSDYFSDSGYSSAKSMDYDQSKEEVEKIQRRTEQEKAQIRLELTSKLQDERDKRKQLDAQIQELSVKASKIDLAQLNNQDASGRVKELEETCDTLRRKLSEERKAKDNFEDLLSALRGELQDASNERDNLRDEVVPRLRARVEGLEGQAADLEKMTYESTKMQQELQALKTENTSLKQTKPMGSIAEESGASSPSRLSRSNSITGASSAFRLQRPPSLLSRSRSVKTTESRDALSDRLKDVEEQRDALHRALKALLERQECQNRENEKKIRVLEMERDRLLTASPEKAGFSKEVSNLRDEINVLRRRSEEALEQKWQVEKGLAGLKMDLDRAEQEIASLRSLLQEKDILIPEGLIRSSSSSDGNSTPVSSKSLKDAYSELQAAYSAALGRIKNLDATFSGDEKTQIAIQKLEQTLASAISERDLAVQESSSYMAQLEALRASEKTYIESEKVLADELRESARRVEELAVQVRQQLATNQNLRQRLTDTVARGEAAQKSNTQRITALQGRLRTLEDELVAAQTASEERLGRHEDEIRTLKDSHSQQLSRLNTGLRSPRSPRSFPPKSPLSPLFSGSSARSPRLSTTRTGPAMSVSDETQIGSLKAKIEELEKALAEADSEMEEVVGRMNTAQIEVLQLQEERDAAMNQTKKLERALQAEKVKAFEDRFKSLQS